MPGESPPRVVLGHDMVPVAARDLPHLVAGSRNGRALVGFVMGAPRCESDRRRKEAGKGKSLVVAERFEVPPEGFHTHIDAVDRLRLGADGLLRLLIHGRRFCAGDLAQELFAVGRLEGIEPHGAMVWFRERVQPFRYLRQSPGISLTQDRGRNIERPR